MATLRGANAEAARVAGLIALCDHLPLVISLLAHLFSTRRSWNLGPLIEETTTTLLTVTGASPDAEAVRFELGCSG